MTGWYEQVQKLCDDGGFRIRFYSDGEWWERWDRELVRLLAEAAKAADEYVRNLDANIPYTARLRAALAALDEWAQ